MNNNTARPWIISLVLLAAALLLSVAVGSVFIPPATLLTLLVSGPAGSVSLPEPLQPLVTILFSLRLPRTILMALVGAALAGSGTAYQGLFRNPLADIVATVNVGDLEIFDSGAAVDAGAPPPGGGDAGQDAASSMPRARDRGANGRARLSNRKLSRARQRHKQQTAAAGAGAAPARAYTRIRITRARIASEPFRWRAGRRRRRRSRGRRATRAASW